MEQKITIAAARRYFIAKNVFEAYDPSHAGSSYSDLNEKLKGWMKHRSESMEDDCMVTYFFGILPAITHEKNLPNLMGDWNGQATLLYFWRLLQEQGINAANAFGPLSSHAMDETLKVMRPENREGFLIMYSKFLAGEDAGFFSFIFPQCRGKFDEKIVRASIKRQYQRYSGILGSYHLIFNLLNKV